MPIVEAVSIIYCSRGPTPARGCSSFLDRHLAAHHARRRLVRRNGRRRYYQIVRKHLTIDGRRLSYLEHHPPGVRRTLLLLHAFPLNAEMWEPQFAAAPPGWRFIAPDFRGFGESDADGGDLASAGLTLEDYARDVAQISSELGVHDPVVAGLSLGGYTAFALTRVIRGGPSGISGLVLADTRPQADTEEGRAERLRMIGLVDREGPSALAKEMLPRLLAEETCQRRPEIADRVRQLICAAAPEAIKAAVYRMMARPDSTAQLTQVKCPTLIVVGNHDTLTPPALSQEMRARIAGATLTVIPSAGHLSNLEQPSAFNDALHGFLNRV